jgi:hypothetical protein
MKDGSPFGLAGIWENWKEPTSGEWIRTFAIITTDANELVADMVHGRFKSSELATPYRPRTAFASSVRPSASRASAVTLALSLVQAWFRSKSLVVSSGSRSSDRA